MNLTTPAWTPIRALCPLICIRSDDPDSTLSEMITRITYCRKSSDEGKPQPFEKALGMIERFKPSADLLLLAVRCPDEIDEASQKRLADVPQQFRNDSSRCVILVLVGDKPCKKAIPRSLWPDFVPVDLTGAPASEGDIGERSQALAPAELLAEVQRWNDRLEGHLGNTPLELAYWLQGMSWCEARNAVASAFVSGRQDQKRQIVEAAEKGLPRPFEPVTYRGMIRIFPPVQVTREALDLYRNRWSLVG